MSRTDKDLPYWMRATKWRENHYWKCSVGIVACTIPEFKSFDTRRFTSCHWQPLDDVNFWEQAPPKWFLDHVWHNPERRRVRDTARKIIADYNANGDTDLEIAGFQHRHNASWLYW